MPSATAPFVLRAPIAHETWKSPPCDRSTRAALSRPPHPRPNVRDDRDTPLCAGRDGGNKQLIWGNHEADSFFARDWTAQISLKGLAFTGLQPRLRLQLLLDDPNAGIALVRKFLDWTAFLAEEAQ